jgi:hypothetical protein
MHVVKVATTGKMGALCYEGYAFRANERDVSDGVGQARQIEAREASIDHLAEPSPPARPR